MSFASLAAQKMESAWKEAARIEENIKPPVFPNRDYNVVDYGAVPNDSTKLCSEAINLAIVECSVNGGGRVVVPAGTFLTGPVRLKSHVNLYLEKGARLLFSPRKELYLPQVLTRWEGMDCYNYQPLIYAYGESDFAITGQGIIDGNGSKDNWWNLCGSKDYGWKPGQLNQNVSGRVRLLQASEGQLPIEQRIMGTADALRPQLVNFVRCNNVLMEGVTLLNSPFWVIHPLLSENLTFRGLTIKNNGPNGDGCDPESCKNVLIENCFFSTGDDCIAIKSGRNSDGRKWNIPSENIIVRHCEMKNGHGGVVIGSEISGGFKNLFVEDCNMDSPNLDRVIRIKTSPCRGGIIENVYVRNVKVGQCKEAVLKINLLYDSKENCRPDFLPTVRQVYLQNVTCEKSRYGVMIIGLKDNEHVYDIHVSDCTFNGVEQGNSINGAKDVFFNNLNINGKSVSGN
ncbi:MAG: glycoside hydrolase family 28 protein [Bacteroidota bacterium]|nr:glycoside hydrolase family 28 protein [Bacteroidota bacterium]